MPRRGKMVNRYAIVMKFSDKENKSLLDIETTHKNLI